MKIRKAEWLILGGSVLIGIAIGLIWTTSHRAEGFSIPVPVESHSPMLQMPLEDTVQLREQFVDEFKQREGFNQREFYASWIDRIGANGLIDGIQTVYPTCHDRGHDLGKLIYERVGDIPTALEICNGACYSGCMHGVLMEAFTAPEEAPEYADEEDHIDIDAITRQINEVCDPTGKDSGYKEGDCIHGVGHALMFLSEYDIDAAIEACDQFEGYPRRYYCATGAYMEYMNNPKPEDQLFENILSPCDVSPYPAACFRYKLAQTLEGYYQQGGTFSGLIEKCQALPRAARLGCFHGFGNAHGGVVAGGQRSLAEICGHGEREDQEACVDGMMERLGRYQPDVANAICRRTDEWMQEACQQSVDRELYDLTKPFDLLLR